MKKRNLILSFILILALALTCFVGCDKGKGGKDSKVYDISVIIETFDNTFAAFVRDGMQRFEREHPGMLKVTYLDSKMDAATQLTQVENQINNGTQAIICLTVDAKQSGPIVAACKDANVPLIAFNRPFENCDTFVGADAVSAGKMLGEYAGELFGGKADVGIINGIMGQENQYLRRDAIVGVFKDKYPEMKVVLEGTGEWKRDKAMALVETWLESGTKLDGILCLNDDMAVGTYNALAQTGRAGEIKILSINGDPDGINGVNNGEFDCTLFQNPYRQAERALEVAVALIDGEKQDAKVLVDWELVTKDNVADYMKYAE